ncbi:hypothetical protein AAFP30_22255 [Gordonia sp. CPCC 205515]|uniref:hypothetical protein n=1 Tax=Gordonia sp. CPCC 205515 TaxID=3140791 RepID=UPI003AF3B8F5
MAESTGAYQENLDYLVDYAKDDWVGFSPIVGAATSLVRSAYSRESATDMVLALISDLLDQGVQAGDLTDSDEKPFVPWVLTKSEVLERIRADMVALPELPDSGDICWFAIL